MSQAEARTQAESSQANSALARFLPTGIFAQLRGLDWLDWFAIVGLIAITARLYYAFWR